MRDLGKCIELVGRMFSHSPCGKTAKVVRTAEELAAYDISGYDAKPGPYCGIHDPIRKKDRNAVRYAEMKAAWDRDAKIRAANNRIAVARDAIVDAVRDPDADIPNHIRNMVAELSAAEAARAALGTP